MSLRSPLVLLLLAPVAIAVACAARGTNGTDFTTAVTSSSVTSTGAGGSGGGGAGGTGGDVLHLDGGLEAGCVGPCSFDLHTVVDCNGDVVTHCSSEQACDALTGTCAGACEAATHDKRSVGCEYYATDMDQDNPGLCFTAFIANTWSTAAHIAVDFAGTTLPVGDFAAIPGMGANPPLAPYDPVTGLAPGQVAILFLAGTPGSDVLCPWPTALTTGAQIFNASGIGNSFHITTDVPVVAYEMNPYGGGLALVTGASLLLPTSVWDTNYLAVTASPADLFGPSMNIIASADGTTVTMIPTVAVEGGGALEAGAANTVYSFMLDKGQQAQFTQSADLTGSIIQSDKPIGFMAGQPCLRMPLGVAYCDHAEQMVPPIKALGNEYVGVMFRPRVPGDMAIWHLIGAVGGTTLGYEPAPPPGAPLALEAGQVADFITDQPFVVKSQDMAHPFMLFTYMSGSQWSQLSLTPKPGYGDPDFVISVPPQQYLSDYVFFADPAYPESNLVVIRKPNASLTFDDVTLDCAGVLTGWQPIGDYEWTRTDLSQHDFQEVGACSTGAHQIKSAGPFGLWVWGWGTPESTPQTGNVSYGYPGGMNVQPINPVVIQPVPQ